MKVSVVLCTFNPDQQRLQMTIDSLSGQVLPDAEWELLLVDNASKPAINEREFDLPSNVTHIQEHRQGLIYARIAGLQAARGELVCFCDDDTPFAPDYLSVACEVMAAETSIGLISGTSEPKFESAPPSWSQEFFPSLALYDHGPEIKCTSGLDGGYPAFIGGGGGAVFRRLLLNDIVREIMATNNGLTGRKGDDLASGEDNDLVLRVLTRGWKVAYVPSLRMNHVIPASRLTRDYLARLSEGIARSWVKVLHHHGISPWVPTSRIWLPLQIGRAYLRFRPWTGPAAYIRWRGACGQFKGRADLHERNATAQPVKRDCVKTGGGAP